MNEFDLVLEHINTVSCDTLTHDRPYIPKVPRDSSSIAYVTDGVLLYSVDGHTYRAERGSVIVVTPGAIDISCPEGESVSYVFSDFFAVMPELSPEGLDRVNHPPHPEEILAMFREALDYWQSRSFGYRVHCKELLHRIIVRIATHNFNASINYYKYNRIRPAILRMEQDFALPLTVAELAQLCSMSTGNMTRLFGEITDRSPMEYLTHVRIENAKRLLRTGAFNVSEIANQCGFTSIYSFSRTFKRLCGVSPLNWR